MGEVQVPFELVQRALRAFSDAATRFELEAEQAITSEQRTHAEQRAASHRRGYDDLMNVLAE